MLNHYVCFESLSDITQLQNIESGMVAVATKHHGIRFLWSSDFTSKLQLNDKLLISKVLALAFSPNGKFLAFSVTNCIYIIDVRTKKIINVIESYDETIDILKFDLESYYLIAGSQNGRVYQYRFDGSLAISRLCSFPYKEETKIRDNFVSAFALHDGKLACSGYGGAIFIIDLNSQVNTTVITISRVRTNALCFVNSNTLISGNVDGVIEVMSTLDRRVHKRVNSPFMKIKQIIMMPNSDYIAVLSQSRSIGIVNIKTHKIVHSRYVEFESSTKFMTLINDETILVALEDKTIVNIALPTRAKLHNMIDAQDLKGAFEVIASEPMLKDSIESKILEDEYQKEYKKASVALSNGDSDLAHRVTDKFRDIPSKKDEILMMFKGYKEFDRYKVLYAERKYTLCYAMISKYPALKNTAQYRVMEKQFKASILDAQRQMEFGRKDMAKSILSEYVTIASKKAVIKFTLNSNSQLSDFLEAIESRDMQKIKELIKAHGFFAQIPAYVSFKANNENAIYRVQEALRVGDIALAKEIIEELEHIPQFVDLVTKLTAELGSVERLKKSYNRDEIKECYNIIDGHKSLKNLELTLLLEKHWGKLMRRCEEYALGGDIKSIKETLGELLTLNTRKDKIGDLLKLAFYSKIENAIYKKSYKKSENLIYSYIDIFGENIEIKEIMKFFHKHSKIKLALSQNHNRAKSRDLWRESDYFNLDI